MKTNWVTNWNLLYFELTFGLFCILSTCPSLIIGERATVPDGA